MIPLFSKEIWTGSLSSQEGFLLTTLVSLSPKIFQPIPPQSLSLYIPNLKWVSHHEGSLALGRWAPLCCIYLDKWGPLNILEMPPLELALASKFVYGKQISPRHYIMPSTISCGDRFGPSSVWAFHCCSIKLTVGLCLSVEFSTVRVGLT